MWFFGGKERRRAAELIRLSKQTVSLMESLLADERQSEEDRRLIREHLEARLEEIRLYATIATGKQDAIARLISPLRYYDTYRRAMMNELAVFSGSGAKFAAFLRDARLTQ